MILSTSIARKDFKRMKFFANGKANWKIHYLQTDSIYKANQLSDFKIYPNPNRTQLKKKLEYLKKNNLNLYLDSGTR